jgi:hypothetical protein
MIKPNQEDIDFLSNPFEHIITVDIKVEKIEFLNKRVLCNL